MANPSGHPIRLVLTRRLPEPVMALFDRGFTAWCNGDDLYAECVRTAPCGS